MTKFWMVYVEGTSGCTHKHLTQDLAMAEAERLARLSDRVGRNVFILESTAFCVSPERPVIWESLKEG